MGTNGAADAAPLDDTMFTELTSLAFHVAGAAAMTLGAFRAVALKSVDTGLLLFVVGLALWNAEQIVAPIGMPEAEYRQWQIAQGAEPLQRNQTRDGEANDIKAGDFAGSLVGPPAPLAEKVSRLDWKASPEECALLLRSPDSEWARVTEKVIAVFPGSPVLIQSLDLYGTSVLIGRSEFLTSIGCVDSTRP